LVFLVGAGLFLRTIHALRQVPLGFTQQNVLTGGIILNGGSAVSLKARLCQKSTSCALPICPCLTACAPFPA
jgi:hypothetical protein